MIVPLNKAAQAAQLAQSASVMIPQSQIPDPQFALMAAAQMHDQGRLIKPTSDQQGWGGGAQEFKDDHAANPEAGPNDIIWDHKGDKKQLERDTAIDPRSGEPGIFYMLKHQYDNPDFYIPNKVLNDYKDTLKKAPDDVDVIPMKNGVKLHLNPASS